VFGERLQILEGGRYDAIVPGRTLRELFERAGERSPDAVALIWEGEELSYAELNARAKSACT